MKKRATEEASWEGKEQALRLHATIAALMREFRLEPGLLAGSPYTGLHANDIGLFEVLAEPSPWSVRGIANAVQAPISTISSALDRLERSGLVKRIHSAEDRRVVRVEMTARGKRLASRLSDAHVLNCQNMLLRLTAAERDEFLRLAGKVAGKA